MAQEFLAVVGANTKIQEAGHSGTIILGVPGTKLKADSKFVYKDLTVVNISAGSNGAGCANASGVGVMNATSTKVKTEGQFVLRKGDTGVVPMTGTDGGGNPCSYTSTVEIDNAGQAKAKGE